MAKTVFRKTPYPPITAWDLAFRLATAHDPLPYDPQVLRPIVHALLQRLGKLSPIEALAAQDVISSLDACVLMEKLSPFLPNRGAVVTDDDISKLLKLVKARSLNRERRQAFSLLPLPARVEDQHPSLLACLARPCRNRSGQHWAGAVRQQHELMRFYLREHPWPRGWEDRQRWIRTHGHRLLLFLRSFRCGCETRKPYPTSFNGLTKDRIESAHTPGESIREILLYFHGIGPRTLDTILAPPRKERRHRAKTRS